MAKRAEKTQSLGERVRMMRERQHLDIKQLAEKTGYKEEYLNKIEEGKNLSSCWSVNLDIQGFSR
ncbi:MAG: helix-turn-helix domain-containing protein [Desulfomonilaceae bacterium]